MHGGCSADRPVRRVWSGALARLILMTYQSKAFGKRAILSTGQGVLTAVYYSTPDFIPSKLARGVVKTAITLGITGLAVLEYRDEKQGALEDSDLLVQPAAQAPGELIGGPSDRNDEPHPAEGLRDEGGAASREKGFSDFWLSLTPARRAGLSGLGIAGALATAAGIAAAERGIYRFSERRAERGVVAAHTKTGLVISGLTTLLALIPPPKNK